MKLLTIALTLVLLLTACEATPTGKSTQGFSVPKYSEYQRYVAADELESGSCNMLGNFMGDYKVLRDQARIR